jgi:hypothetical protein
MMIEVGQEINQFQKMGVTQKKLGVRAFQTLINFQQMFVQGLWEKKDPLLQLPNMDEDEIKRYRRNLKTHQIPDARIETFCKLSTETRSKLGLFDGDKAKLSELEKAIKAMPMVSLEYKVHTDGEAVITAVDVITFQFKLKYENLKEDQQPGFVCSKKYPFLKKQNWYVIICDAKTKETVIHFEKISVKEGDGNIAKFEMKQRFGQPGNFKFHAFFMNDSYLGFDLEQAIEFNVALEDKNRVIPPVSKEDLDAVKGPGMVQSMLDIKAEDDSDDESSDDGAQTLISKLEKAGLKEATVAREKKEGAGAGKKVAQDNQLLK